MALSDFLLISDYPIDKVIYRSPVTPLVVSAFNVATIILAHGNGGEFLPIAQWSLDPTFSTGVYDVSTGPSSAGVQLFNTAVAVDATNIRYDVNNNTASGATVYFRTIGLAVPGTDRDVPSTSQFQDFNMNTDRSYMKVVSEGSATIANNANHTAPVPAVVGGIPKVLVWTKFGGTISPLIWTSRSYGSFPDSGAIAYVDASLMSILNRVGISIEVYYRMYAI